MNVPWRYGIGARALQLAWGRGQEDVEDAGAVRRIGKGAMGAPADGGEKMRYLALLYGNEGGASEPGTTKFDEEVARYDAFDAAVGDAVVAGEALEPTSEGLMVRHGSDGPVITDGVSAETTEVVGGFYVLEADDLDAAIELARQIPAVTDGTVELRPLVEWFQDARPAHAGMRRYLALLTGPETEADLPGTDAWDRGVAEHARFGREAGDAVMGGAALRPAESGTVVRARGGETLVAEGTFAEATEVVGGLYILQASSREEVGRLAARIPIGHGDAVHIRPIIEFEG